MRNIVELVAAVAAAIACSAEVPPGDAGGLRPAPTALAHAHAHNDYYHNRPLWDALQLGFASVEADVFLVDGQLLVGHYPVELRRERSLQALYLDPLRKHIAANEGRVFAGPQRLTLLVDFKSDAAESYAALARLLAQYDGMVSRLDDGQWIPGAVDVVISGARPLKELAADPARRAAIDGRFADALADAPVHLVPLISESWASHFTWRGAGTMPPPERARLDELVARAHAQGRRLRFWGTPSGPAAWSQLRAAQVDLLGADDITGLHQFLTAPRD